MKVKDRDMVLGYSMRYTVLDNNTVENASGMTNGWVFYPKINVSHFQFRRSSFGATEALAWHARIPTLCRSPGTSSYCQ